MARAGQPDSGRLNTPGTGRRPVLPRVRISGDAFGNFAEGFARFENSTDAFLASRAPWIAFLLVSGGLFAFRAPPLDALTTVVVLLCWLLAPPVVTQAVALQMGDRTAV